MSREKQIEEMANDIAAMCPDLVDSGCGDLSCVACLARGLEQMCYRKQIVGEWTLVQNGKGVCSVCHRLDTIDKLAQFCRYCGAHLRPAEEPKKHFTPEEVRGMTAKDVRDNYQAIMESMKRWE